MASSKVEFQQFTPPPYEEPPRQRGCFFYGCVIASILSLLLLIAVGLIFFFVYRWAGKMIDEYTGTAPRELPKVEMPAENRRTLAERVDAFEKAVKEGKPTEPLVLSSEDLNALIEERAPNLKGKIYATIEKDRLKGQVSIPLDDVPSLGLTRGRYLNGEADLNVSLEDGVLLVTIDSFEINGKRPPKEFMDSLRTQNIVKDMYKDAKTAEDIRKLESIEIKDGKIIIKARDRNKAKEGTKPADSPKGESKESKDVAPPPEQKEKKPEPPNGVAPADGKVPAKEPASPESRPTTPAEPSKKP
jgi:hypothetical protein